MANSIKIPKVRFAGFNDNWRNQELGEILTERKILQKITEDAPLLAFASGQGVINVSDRKTNNRDFLTIDQSSKIYKLTEYNDIVYNPSNLKYGAIDRNKLGKGVISPIYVTFETDEEPSFIELIVKSERFKLRALRFEEGTVIKRQSVKPENLLSLEVNLSKSSKEQLKLGGFFENVDTLLIHHHYKHKKILALKNAMLEKMFPKNNSDVPEIRFKGFSGSWQKDKGFNLFTTITDKNHPDLPVLSASQKWGMIRRENSIKKNIHYKRENEINYKRVLPGQFVIHLRSFQGGFAHSNKEGITSPAYTVIDFISRKNHYDYFWKYFFNSEKFIKSLELITYGVRDGRSINYNDFTEMTFTFPDKEEQLKIGKYFQQLDNLISMHNNQIEKLQNIKNALFEKLLV